VNSAMGQIPCSTERISCFNIYTALRYASALYAVALCPTVCLSVHPSITSRSSTNQSDWSRGWRQTIAQDSTFLKPKEFDEITLGHPHWGRQIQVW